MLVDQSARFTPFDALTAQTIMLCHFKTIFSYNYCGFLSHLTIEDDLCNKFASESGACHQRISESLNHALIQPACLLTVSKKSANLIEYVAVKYCMIKKGSLTYLSSFITQCNFEYSNRF